MIVDRHYDDNLLLMGSYKDLDVWKVSMEVVKEVYLITKNFPQDERFGLTS